VTKPAAQVINLHRVAEVVAYERSLWPEFVIGCWLLVIGNSQSDR
jgi:hypothetical protein